MKGGFGDGTDRQAQKEAIEINKSLTALGDAGALGPLKR